MYIVCLLQLSVAAAPAASFWQALSVMHQKQNPRRFVACGGFETAKSGVALRSGFVRR